MSRISSSRQIERRIYGRRRRAYLEAHPLCQIYMARNRLDERAVLQEFLPGPQLIPFCFHRREGDLIVAHRIPAANQVHHRNKADHERLLLEDYWMSGSPAGHTWAEDHKDEARKIGVLCPINARTDGTLPDGLRCLTTTELLKARAAGFDDTTISQNYVFSLQTMEITP